MRVAWPGPARRRPAPNNALGEAHARYITLFLPLRSSFQWNEAPYDVPNMFAKPGTPCNDYNGYCDVFKKCREVDPSGPIATLRKLLLSEENIASFKKWALDHWYYCGMIFLSFLSLMVRKME